MGKRHKDALAIQEGACNPSGIAAAIFEACREARAENATAHMDAAVRLMVHQLAFICGITSGVEDLAKAPDYSACTDACRKALAADAAKVVKPDRDIATRIVGSWAEAVRPPETRGGSKSGFDVS